eukprot:tig00001208_g7522.t1
MKAGLEVNQLCQSLALTPFAAFQPQAGETVFHQGKGVEVSFKPEAEGAGEAVSFQASVFISTQRAIFVERHAPDGRHRAVLPVPLDAIQDETLVSRLFHSDYVKFKTATGELVGKFRITCGHLPRSQASHAVQKVYFVLLFRLCEVRFRPVFLQEEPEPCDYGCGAPCRASPSASPLPPSPARSPGSVHPCCLPGEGGACGMPELHLPPPALPPGPASRSRRGSNASTASSSSAASAASGAAERHALCTCPAGAGACEGTCQPRATRRRGSNGKIKQPFVDLASGEVQYLECEFEPRRVAFAADGVLYLAEEPAPATIAIAAGPPLAGLHPTPPPGPPPRQFSTKDLQRTLQQVRALCKRYQ